MTVGAALLARTAPALAGSPLDEIDPPSSSLRWTVQAAAAARTPFGRAGDKRFDDLATFVASGSLYGGLWITRSLGVLGWGGYTFGSDCTKCGTHWVHLGGEVQVRPLRRPRVEPWIGLGVAWHQLRQVFGGSTPGAWTFRGVELARLTVALDLRVAPALALAPFAEAAFGVFSGARSSGDVEVLRDAPSKYGTLGGGVRLVLGPRD